MIGLNLSLVRSHNNYRPEISYSNWGTSPVAAGGVRFLHDSGSKGMHNAELNFGRGVKFNGVDQSIELKDYTCSSEVSLTALVYPAGNKVQSQKPFFGGNDRIMVTSVNGDFWVVEADLRRTGGEASVFISELLQTGDMYDITIVSDDINIYTYVNGVINKVTIGTLENMIFTEIGASTNRSAYLDGTISNVRVINQALTPEQIQYQYNYPEKFLYREDKILKSMVLNQNEIDNVVAYLPCCETDGYVRDLANYSKGDIISPTGVWHGSSGITITNNNEVYTVSGDTGTYAYLRLSKTGSMGAYTEDLTEGDNVNFSCNLATTSGSFEITCPSGNLASSEDGLYSITYTHNGDTSLYARVYLHSDSSEIVISNTTSKKLTGTYSIQNFTNACRAKNLTTGLQTCFWKRDVLGVPYESSFKALTWNKSDDTRPALNLNMTDTQLNEANGGKWQIEFVIKREVKTVNNFLLNTKSNHKGLQLDINRTFSPDKIRIYLLDGSNELFIDHTVDNQHHHIVFTNDGANIMMTVDGVDGTPKAHSFVPSGLNFADSTRQSPVGELRLFNIHTEPQDPQELYQSAVRKGLLT